MALVASSVAAYASDTYSRDAAVLPKTAQSTIADNFKAKVNLVKIDKELGRISEYDVTLTDGSEITFDREGNWKEIEVGRYSHVPSAFVPESVAKYVKSKHLGQRILGIERTRTGLEVELSNSVDIVFDKSGAFVRYD